MFGPPQQARKLVNSTWQLAPVVLQLAHYLLAAATLPPLIFQTITKSAFTTLKGKRIFLRLTDQLTASWMSLGQSVPMT